MRFKFLSLALLLLAASASLFEPCYATAGDCAIKPPADWSSGTSNIPTGTPITITALPGEWAENQNYKTPSGSYSNTLLYAGSQSRYHVKIWLDGSLSNGSSTIPASSIKYIFTYVYMYYGTGDPRNGEGAGTPQDYAKYAIFSPFETEVYYCSVNEAPAFPLEVQGQFQFKYAVQVPNNQAPGTYSGATINYKIIPDVGTPITRTCPLSLTVGSKFQMTVDRGTIDFEKMSPGETKDNVPVEGVIATSSTNNGNPWYLKISNDSPLSSGPYMIPNTNFIWYGWTYGTGRWYGTGTDQLSPSPLLVYSSSAAEGNNLPGGTLNHLKFKLTIPKGQPGGKYLSTIRLTMTE